MTFTHALATNNYGTAKFIVTSSAANGTHTTIASALTAASSGDTIFIRPGTYTEDLTLKAGVNLTAYVCDAYTPNVIILGKCTATFAGTCSLSGIQLKTNSDNCLVVSGSSATIVNLNLCKIDCNNNTGISYTSSSSSSAINLFYCSGNIDTTGITYFSMTSTGTLNIKYCDFLNDGASTTASTSSNGEIVMEYSRMNAPITSSDPCDLTFRSSIINTRPTNTTSLTIGGAGPNAIVYCRLLGGTSSAVSIGGTANLLFCDIGSSNTNAVTGAGTLVYSGLFFSSTSNKINTTTVNADITRPGITLSSQQPCFQGNLTATTAAITGDATTATITWGSEIFDQNNNLSGTTFTAPYTGRYYLSAQVLFGSLAAGHTAGFIQIVTTARTYVNSGDPIALAGGGTQANLQIQAIADMTAGDTATVQVQVSGGAKVVTAVKGGATDPRTWFMGYLIC